MNSLKRIVYVVDITNVYLLIFLLVFDYGQTVQEWPPGMESSSILNPIERVKT